VTGIRLQSTCRLPKEILLLLYGKKALQFFRTLNNNNIVSPLLRLYANDRAVDDNGGRGQGLHN